MYIFKNLFEKYYRYLLADGIMSSAQDGIKVAEKVIEYLKK